MAAILLGSLSLSERIALPFLESLANTGLGANEILRRYAASRESILAGVRARQSEELQFYERHIGKLRRQRGLGLVRFLKQQTRRRPYSLNLTRRALPTVESLPIGRLGMSHNYAYKFRAEGVLQDGSRVERWVTVTSNRLVPWGDVEGIAQDYFQGEDTSGGLVAYTFVHQDILRRPEAPAPV